MNKFKSNMIFFLIISFPIIDILTTFTMNWPLTVGALFRTLLIAVLFLYILMFYFFQDRRKILLFIMPFIFLGISFVFQYFTKHPFYIMQELQFYFKTTYFLIMLNIIYILNPYKVVNKNIMFKAISIVTIIVVSSYWFAIISGTSLASYPNDKSGYSGWFFAANELSVIILILLALVIVQLMYKFTITNFLLFLSILTISPMIGTKTAFFGTILIFLFFIIGMLTLLPSKKIIPIFILLIVFFIFLPKTPAIHNISPASEQTKPIEAQNSKALDNMLSSRDDYFLETKNEYLESSFMKKLVGLGYAGNYKTEPKTIEMDFYDLFFSFGIIGSLLILIPLLQIMKQLIRLRNISLDYLILLFTSALCLGIAFFVGHVIFAPAVMSYVGVLLLMIKLLNQEMIEDAT